MVGKKSSNLYVEELESIPASDALSRRKLALLTRFPWVGIGALCGVLVCLTGSISILVISNDRTQTQTLGQVAWPEAVAPNVLVSICNSIANFLFGVAISKTNVPISSGS
jgi:hypothetical protein